MSGLFSDFVFGFVFGFQFVFVCKSIFLKVFFHWLVEWGWVGFGLGWMGWVGNLWKHRFCSTVWRDQNFDRYRDRDFLSETNFSDTNTETFFPRPNFPRPIPRLFFRDQIFQYRYRDFFNETKFFDTDTETFFSRPKLLIPIPRLSKNCHGSRDWDRDRDFCIWLTTDYRQLLANFSTFSL